MMEVLIVCDALNKYIESDDPIIGVYADNINKYWEKEETYVVFLQRVIGLQKTHIEEGLNPAMKGADEANIPVPILKIMKASNMGLVFRDSMNPFQSTEPHLGAIVEAINKWLKPFSATVTGFQCAFMDANSPEANNAVICCFH